MILRRIGPYFVTWLEQLRREVLKRSIAGLAGEVSAVRPAVNDASDCLITQTQEECKTRVDVAPGSVRD